MQNRGMKGGAKIARYRYLPHTADVAFVAYGGSARETIENAAEALLGIMLDTGPIMRSSAKRGTVRIAERAQSIDSLAWYTLQRIVSEVDKTKLHAYAFKVDRLERGRELRLAGRLLFAKSAGDPFMLDVKAVTPHGLEMKRTARGYSMRVLVDV